MSNMLRYYIYIYLFKLIITTEEQQLGAYACKLPCGHLFHKECVVGWLEKNCTCPVCRFELETDGKKLIDY